MPPSPQRCRGAEKFKSNLFPVEFSGMRIAEHYFGLTKGLSENRRQKDERSLAGFHAGHASVGYFAL